MISDYIFLLLVTQTMDKVGKTKEEFFVTLKAANGETAGQKVCIYISWELSDVKEQFFVLDLVRCHLPVHLWVLAILIFVGLDILDQMMM